MESRLTDALIDGVHAQVFVKFSACILLFAVVFGEFAHVLHTFLQLRRVHVWERETHHNHCAGLHCTSAKPLDPNSETNEIIHKIEPF